MSRPTPGAPHLDVAGWLLGALDANEAAAFQAHLASCPECQAEVERLRPTVTLLSTAAQDVEVPPLLADRTVAAVRDSARRRRRQNWTVRALIAAAVVALLSLGAVALFTRSSAETFEFAMSSPNGGPAAGTAGAHHTNRGWSIQLSLHGLPALNDRAFYECWYVNPAKDSPPTRSASLPALSLRPALVKLTYRCGPGLIRKTSRSCRSPSNRPTAIRPRRGTSC